MAIKAEGLACHKTRFNQIYFFKKCPVPSQEYGNCYIIVRFYVRYILTLCFFYVFVFFYIWVRIHIIIRRVTVLFYPKFMYIVLMLYLLLSSDFF